MTEDRLDQHVNGDRRRWLMLTWAVIVAYVVGAVISFVLGVLVVRAANNARQVEQASCVIVRLIEDGTDRERSLVATTRQSLSLIQQPAERRVRLRSLRAHERSLKVGVRLSSDLREHVSCPPHTAILDLKSP